MNRIISLVLFLVVTVSFGVAQDPTPSPTTTPFIKEEVTVKDTQPNTDPIYQEFRKLSESPNSFSGEYATVNNLVLKRDAATFTLKSGEFYFLTPAEGKRTGGVFIGDGEMTLVPPVDSEKRMLNVFIKSPQMTEKFSKLVVFFTDKTFDEIKASPNAKISTNGAQSMVARDSFKDKENLLKNEFRYNITIRLLMDAYSSPRPGFFTSFIDGQKYNKLLFMLDPLGIPDVSPEQVMLKNYSESVRDVWTAFHLADEYKKGTAKSSTDRRIFDMTHHDMDVAIKGERIIGRDTVTLATLSPSERVLPMDLYPFMRIKRITDEDGKNIDFIQEDKAKDADLAVILPAAKEVGKPFKLTFEYDGTDALLDIGAGNFILRPRSTWYPNNGGTQFGDRATFDITFHYPKKYIMIGVGEKIQDLPEEEGLKVERWSTKGVEMAVAGFNYGSFKKKEIKDEATGYTLEVYANSELPVYVTRYIESREGAGGKGTETTMGAANTVSGMGGVLTEAQNSVRVFNNFFGRLPHNRIAMTQQPITGGQAWPTLIYMPFNAYFDSTIRTQMQGVRRGNSIFFDVVGPHEVAHQWWGHAVGWTSYHDQWMSEGFAHLSASIYLQNVEKNMDKFSEFWEAQRKIVVEASPRTDGKAPYTIGPVTMGYRLNTAKTGDQVAQSLIYPKGAYILHMLRLMMYDKKTGDEAFKKMMKDFIASHYNKDVSTEDFKAIVEKHMTPKMDIDGNKKMDWYFDEWVYGTDVPEYKLEYAVDGAKLTAKITQSNVSDNFVMLVPLYADFGDGWVLLGSATVNGNSTVDLGNIKLPQAPKKVAICAYNDILATKIENIKK